MIYTMEEIKRRILTVALEFEIPAMYVFGSYARSEATEDSDVDIVFQYTGLKHRQFLWGAIYEALHECLEKDIHLLTVEQLEQKNMSPWEKKTAESIRHDMVRVFSMSEPIMTAESENTKGETTVNDSKELTRDDIEIDAEMEIDCDIGQIVTAYVETWFDVDRKFGLQTADDPCTWVNLYAKYNVPEDDLKMEYIICHPDGQDECHDYGWRHALHAGDGCRTPGRRSDQF